MFKLNLPQYPLKIKPKGTKYQIWDTLRLKFVALTPEEWVRQNFTAFLIQERGFPQTLMNNEIPVELNGMQKRCDTLVWSNPEHQPLVIVEYKSPKVKITQDTFDQIIRYNISLKVPYLIISNGLQHYCCEIDYRDNSYRYLKEIPNYKELKLKKESMKPLFIQYPKCGTCRKASKFLIEHGVEVDTRDITIDNPNKEELRSWIETSKLPIKKFFNTSGVIYKEMKLKDKIDGYTTEELLDLLASDGKLVKRPLLIQESSVIVGFKEQEWLECINK
ncbi:MAG: Spx/MgsR family RNA polymerase-binding regulatory protein [Bacteroidales bacterium]